MVATPSLTGPTTPLVWLPHLLLQRGLEPDRVYRSIVLEPDHRRNPLEPLPLLRYFEVMHGASRWLELPEIRDVIGKGGAGTLTNALVRMVEEAGGEQVAAQPELTRLDDRAARFGQRGSAPHGNHGRPAVKYPLSGIARCGHCGGSIGSAGRSPCGNGR